VAEVGHRAAVWSPADIERAAAQTARLSISIGDAVTPTAPASGTYTLRRPDGTDLIAAQAVAIGVDAVASYAISASAVPATETLGEGWQERWAITIAGVERIYTRPAALVRQRLWCPVANADVLEVHPELTGYPSTQSSWSPQIDAAWKVADRRLRVAGRRPYLVLSPDALYEPVLYWSLERIFRLLSTYTTGEVRYGELADHYRSEAAEAWGRMTLTYDANDDGHPDAGEQGAQGNPVVFLSARTGAFWTDRRGHHE